MARFRHALVAAQLLAGLLLDLRRHGGLRDLLGEFLDLLGAAVALAQLALDRRHLLAQDHLALALVEAGPGLAADLLASGAAPRCRRASSARDLVQPRGEVDRFQNLLLLIRRGYRDRRRRGPPELPAWRRLHGRRQAPAAPAAGAAAPRAPAAGGEESAPRCSGVTHLRLLDPQNAGDDERPLLHELGRPESAARPGRTTWCVPSGALT